MIIFDKVSKNFGLTRALDEISFNIGRGEFVFLTGPSGSGKTSILRLVMRELTPDTGSIVVNEAEVTKLKARKISKLRQEIGMVFQDFKLIPELTVFENIAVPLRVRGVKAKQIHAQVVEIAKLVGLEHRLNVFPSQMAGGESQRACLARAVIANPAVLLADEPTGNLDPATSWQIMHLLAKFNQQGTTILMATHNMDIVESSQYRTLKIDQGKLVEDVPQATYEKEN